MVLSNETVSEARDEFVALLAERKAAQTSAQAARNVLTSGTAFFNAVAEISDVLPAHVLPPSDPSAEFIEFVSGTANAWKSTPSDELQKLRRKVESYVHLADDFGLTEDDVKDLNAALAQYGQSVAVMDNAQKSKSGSGNGGQSISVRARSLGHVPCIEITDDVGNNVRTPIRPGVQNGQGDWGSGRYELKVVVDGLAVEHGDDPATVWQEVVQNLDLGSVPKALVAVDDGTEDEVLRQGQDRYGNKYTISY